MANRRLAGTFARLKETGQKALMPFLVAGDPDLATTKELCLAAAEAGADLIELGLPFSDPLADGPVIQAASQRALASGTTVRGVFGLTAALRRELEERGRDIPVVLLTYYNPVFHFGVGEFLQEAARSGIDGLVVPDLPIEESRQLETAAEEIGLDFIQLLAPTSTADRLREVGSRAKGFIYCVALTGVTGVRGAVSMRSKDLVDRARTVTSVPLLVGFGISTPDQAAEVSRWADGVIVGSALVQMVGDGADADLPGRIQGRLEEFKRRIS